VDSPIDESVIINGRVEGIREKCICSAAQSLQLRGGTTW